MTKILLLPLGGGARDLSQLTIALVSDITSKAADSQPCGRLMHLLEEERPLGRGRLPKTLRGSKWRMMLRSFQARYPMPCQPRACFPWSLPIGVQPTTTLIMAGEGPQWGVGLQGRAGELCRIGGQTQYTPGWTPGLMVVWGTWSLPGRLWKKAKLPGGQGCFGVTRWGEGSW